MAARYALVIRIVKLLLLATSANSILRGNRQTPHHANLLVVFLLVPLYKLVRDEARAILSRIGQQDSKPPKASGLQSGRYDYFRLFRASLAANRSGATDYGADLAANLPHLQGSDGSACARA